MTKAKKPRSPKVPKTISQPLNIFQNLVDHTRAVYANRFMVQVCENNIVKFSFGEAGEHALFPVGGVLLSGDNTRQLYQVLKEILEPPAPPEEKTEEVPAEEPKE